MRNNEISLGQLIKACIFMTALVCVAIAHKMGPVSMSLLKTNLQNVNTAQ